MRFLCLCGAYGSAEKFRVQLAPLIKELESDSTAELHFIHGPVEAFPPEGFEDFFGAGPYFRFIEGENTEQGGSDVLDRIRDFPKGATPEDQMRVLLRGQTAFIQDLPDDSSDDSYQFISSQIAHDTPYDKESENSYENPNNQSAQDALDYLYKIMEKEGPFDGIIGYSEGAMVAATLLLHEQRRFETRGVKPMFKCGLFFAGWPPMNPELDSIVLADESELTITIPTCHVIGSLDPYLAGSLALYNICDMDTAYMFDHAKGHTLPRDKETVRELGDIIREMKLNLEA